MSAWPPVWETSFAFGAAGRAAHYSCVVAEIEHAPALAELDDEERRSLANTLLRLDGWASAAEMELRDCPWPREALRSPKSPPVAPVAELDREGKARRRYGLLVDLVDACGTARACILKGELAYAVEWAALAGNRSLLDLAEIGRKSRATLPKRGVKRASSPDVQQRNAGIVAEAEAMLASEPDRSLHAIARAIVRRRRHTPGFPRVETVRKMLAGLKNPGPQGLRAQISPKPL